MASATILSTICFVVCHGGPADHVSAFAQCLIGRNYPVQIYATEPALGKFKDWDASVVKPFVLEKGSEKEAAKQLAQTIALQANVVITDVGHPFDVMLQEQLANMAPLLRRYAYYDNPEPYVPGGYSETAAQVMKLAQKTLFANVSLSKDLQSSGIGYYPVHQAEVIVKRRHAEQAEMRKQLFSAHSMVDAGQKIVVYFGGNNDIYFEQALPAFLRFIEESSKTGDLSGFVILVQQHPGAKASNTDVQMVETWLKSQETSSKLPTVWISEMSSSDAQSVADMASYYQTSMGPQFVLAEIPTFQVGHDTYEDILVRNKLCASVTDSAGFLEELARLSRQQDAASGRNEIVYQGLGIDSNWEDRLIKAIQE